MASKHRVRISGTIGKSIRVGETRPIMGINVDHPAGGTPTLEQWKEIFCCVQPAPENPIWEWPNLSQLARLNCCGIIVRRCSDGEESTALVFKEWEELSQVELFSSATGNGTLWRALRLESDEVVVDWTFDYTSTAFRFLRYLDGPTYHLRRRWRRIDIPTGAVLSTGTVDIPTYGNRNAESDLLLPVRNSNAIGVYGRNTAPVGGWHFFTDAGAYSGTIQNASGDVNWFYMKDGLSWYHPGAGVVLIWGVGGIGVSPPAEICLYSAESADSLPGNIPVASCTVPYPANALSILGTDSLGRVYVGYFNAGDAANRKVIVLDAGLTSIVKEINGADIQAANTPLVRYVHPMGSGQYLMARDGVDAHLWRQYDISGPSPVLVDSFTTSSGEFFDYTNATQMLGNKYLYIAQKDHIFSVLDEVVTSAPPKFDWDCNYIEGVEGRIEVTNGDSQDAGPIIIDLAEVTQANSGALRAITLDAWGRVVGNRAVTEDDLVDLGAPDPAPDAGAPSSPVVVELDGGLSATDYATESVRYGDEGSASVQYGLGATDLDERGAAGSITGVTDPPGTPPADPDAWSPMDLNPRLWLDAGDVVTLETVGTDLERWLDKSGNSNHAVPVGLAGTTAPTVGPYGIGSSVIFGGDGDITPIRTPLMSQPNSSIGITVAVVAEQAQPDGGASTARFLLSQTSGSQFMKLAWFSNASLTDAFDNTSRWYIGTSALALQSFMDLPVPREPVIWTGDISNSILRQSINGIIADDESGAYSRPQGTIGYLYIGGVQNAGLLTPPTPNHFKGGIHEIVLVHGVLSQANRQRLEGYLAHKWGLDDNLPVDHPFKATPP